ncbi:hypothetical protein [Aridibaculum aurantiacum]|uniref:hypothetical protein n=1 Tax=Aridibaculum aurantiacum TaxID=2810307 RepID=UPI001A96B0CD|nr:hypothetical protein [Aridibaculum aurantiacum]
MKIRNLLTIAAACMIAASCGTDADTSTKLETPLPAPRADSMPVVSPGHDDTAAVLRTPVPNDNNVILPDSTR